MTTKELALTICEMFQKDYNNRPIWQTMLEIEDLIDKQRPKQFFIANVSQQREMLIAYHKHLDSFNDSTIYNASESMIDDYLANNRR